MNEQPNLGPLDEDLSTVNTALPLLQAGLYDLRCDKATIQPTKDATGRVMKLDLVTTSPAISHGTGETLPPGVHVFTNCTLQPSGNATWDMVKRNLGAVVQAAGLIGVTGNTIDAWHKQLEGKILRAKVKYVPETTGKQGETYASKNEVVTFLKQ